SAKKKKFMVLFQGKCHPRLCSCDCRTTRSPSRRRPLLISPFPCYHAMLRTSLRSLPMDIFEAVASRYSCRAFLPTPIPEATVRDIVERAARAPSAGNMQPWRIYALAGKRVEELKALLAPRMAAELPKGEGADYTIFPGPLAEPYRSRRFAVGELLYKSIDIPREDKPARYQ